LNRTGFPRPNRDRRQWWCPDFRVLLTALLIAGCAPVQPPPPPSVVLPPVAEAQATSGLSTPLLGTFATAYRGQQVAIRGRPTGALLLSGRKRERNRVLCTVIGKDLQVPDQPTGPSIYLLDRRKAPQRSAAPGSCGERLAHYDYFRAGKDLVQYGLKDAIGPVLIAYSGRRSRDLVWDLSRFPDADLARAILIWERLIPRDPKRAKRGWPIAMIDRTIESAFQASSARKLAQNRLPKALERKPLFRTAKPKRGRPPQTVAKLGAGPHQRTPKRPR
jgi:hypothetical protein